MQLKLIDGFIYIVAAVLVLPTVVVARDSAMITDCYVKNFDSSVAVEANGSLLVEENILTDCGTLSGKHGIFRVIPEQVKTNGGTFVTPVKLIGVTDENGNPRQYAESRDSINHTVSCKIGNPNVTIARENTYKIIYSVANAVRAGANGKDELYWNLSGNFWEMEIDKFNAQVAFPQGVNRNNSEVYIYSGTTGAKQNLLADAQWISNNTLEIKSKVPLGARQGITLSATFPAGIIGAYRPGFWDLYRAYLWLAIPLLVFVLAFKLWAKHGRDPVVGKP